MKRKSSFMNWIDGELERDPGLARDVDQLINEMKIEQELVALREKRGLSQRQLARRLGTTQPYVAKLESGRIRNLGLKTLAKCASALDATLIVSFEARPAGRATRTAKKALRPAGPRRAMRRAG